MRQCMLRSRLVLCRLRCTYSHQLRGSVQQKKTTAVGNPQHCERIYLSDNVLDNSIYNVISMTTYAPCLMRPCHPLQRRSHQNRNHRSSRHLHLHLPYPPSFKPCNSTQGPQKKAFESSSFTRGSSAMPIASKKTLLIQLYDTAKSSYAKNG